MSRPFSKLVTLRGSHISSSPLHERLGKIWKNHFNWVVGIRRRWLRRRSRRRGGWCRSRGGLVSCRPGPLLQSMRVTRTAGDPRGLGIRLKKCVLRHCRTGGEERGTREVAAQQPQWRLAHSKVRVLPSVRTWRETTERGSSLATLKRTCQQQDEGEVSTSRSAPPLTYDDGGRCSSSLYEGLTRQGELRPWHRTNKDLEGQGQWYVEIITLKWLPPLSETISWKGRNHNGTNLTTFNNRKVNQTNYHIIKTRTLIKLKRIVKWTRMITHIFTGTQDNTWQHNW
jgi:hypothetical protein